MKRRMSLPAAWLLSLLLLATGCAIPKAAGTADTLPAASPVPATSNSSAGSADPSTSNSSAGSAGPATSTTPIGSTDPATSPSSAAISPAVLPQRIRTADGSREGVYYEVFVRAFADGNGDGTGDLEGLIRQLDYLNDGMNETTEDLGVTGIWLMPIHPSPSYHGYDVTDYLDINPEYGSLDTFRNLLDQAHSRGISVIMDLVLNHTSDKHPWFVNSAAGNPVYQNWYRWASPEDSRYALSASVWGHPVWNRRNSSLYYAIFWDGMPDLNYDEPAVRQEMKDVATFWLDLGVDGFRLDAVPHIYGTAELPDNGIGLDPTRAWWKEFREHCQSVNPDVLLVGEVLDGMAARLPYADLFDSVFQVDLGDAIANAVKGGNSRNDYLASLLERQMSQYREKNPNFLNTPILSNHDQNRIYGLLGGNPERMKLAASMLLLTEGLPFLYYGEEIGMFGSKPDEDIRLPFLWGNDTMQSEWRTSRYTKVIPASMQIGDPDSLQTHYRRLIQLRTAYPSLYNGKIQAVQAENPAVVAWRMNTDSESALVLFNLSPEPVSLSLSRLTGASGAWKLLFEQHVGSTGLSTFPDSNAEIPPEKTFPLRPQTTVVLIQ